MKLRARPSTLRDAMAILENPSRITAAEIDTAGYTTWSLLKAIRSQMQAGEATTVSQDSGPLFVIGHYPDPLRSRNRIMWFIASEQWFGLGARSVLYGRRFMRDLRKRFPDTSFTCISWSKHPDLVRWFAFQGFLLEERAHQAAVFKSVG
ncbi:MAG TPA: hypothetical protein VIU82_26015 [Bosea sp. (in: a-proteobacteria)]